jgi:chromosomal replication initiation ATPase DnaA
MDEFSLITETLLSLIKEKAGLSNSIFNLWFGELKLLSLTEEKAVFSTPTPLKKNILLTKYRDIIKDCLF